MGMVSGITVFHNQMNKAQDNLYPFAKHLQSKAFTAKALYNALAPILETNPLYKMTYIDADSFEIELIEEGYTTQQFESFSVSETSTNECCIKSEFFTPTLYKALSAMAVLNHDVVLHCNGKHRFYTIKTINTYKNGHYHYAQALPANALLNFVKDIMTQFKEYTSYWDITLFHDDVTIELNNHHSTFSKNNNTAKTTLYGISVSELNVALHAITSANSENKGAYYFEKLDVDTTLFHLEQLINELIELGKTTFLVVFNPKCQSYYNISATIKGLPFQKVVHFMEASISEANKRTISYSTLHNKDQSITIKGTYESKNTGYSECITTEDILSGHMYLGKLFDAQLFEILQTTIAKQFCTCFIQTEDFPTKVYYANAHDKQLIEDFLNENANTKNWFEGFVKV